jgi:hypothetical protein
MNATARRWVILSHRYLGIALCVLLLSWFLSGIAMIYARGMPVLPRVTRLERMPPLNPALIHISAQDAAVRAGAPRPEEVTMLTIMGRPAFQFGPSVPVTIFADKGERLEHLTVDEALAIGSQFTQVPLTALSHAGVLTRPDQWTLGQRRAMPLHKLVASDDLGTVIYVSQPLGEVVMTTTRSARRLAWISAIPHWLYFAALRRHDGLWTSAVLWLSGVGCLAVLLGLFLAILQYRSRYVGWMRWHYRLGVVFGAISLTWIFSGFLSMQPGRWAATDGVTPAVAEALSGGPIDLSQFPPLADGAWMATGQWVRELEFSRIQDTAVYVASGPDRSAVIAANQPHASLEPVSVDSVLRRITAVSRLPAIRDTLLLSAYEAYYYDRDRVLPLPVLRIRFSDSDRTWVYIDLKRSRIVAAVSRRARVERWLYHGLHSFDFPFLYDKRPLWDVVVIALCAGGALLSATAVVIGFRRLFRS